MPNKAHTLIIKDALLEILNDLFVGTDSRDWPRVMKTFAPSVVFDMSSMNGEPAGIRTPQEIAQGWDQGLKPLAAIHHQIGNVSIKLLPDGADVFCYGIALHYRPIPSNNNTRQIVGSYNLHFSKIRDTWKINLFRFNLKFIDGNKDL